MPVRYSKWLAGLLPGILLLPSACSTEIDVNAPNLNVPIVYCLLDTEDSVQYLKLNKTYLLTSAAALTPPEPDSQYFEGEVQVVLERWQGNKPVELIEFVKTDEVPKNPGFFPHSRNTLYKAETRISSDAKYMLSIYIRDKEEIVHGYTQTIGPLKVVDPMDLEIRKVSLNNGVNYTARWQPVEHAGIYQVVLRFHYAETHNEVRTEKYFDWPQSFTSPVSNLDYLSKEISGSRFFYILADSVPDQPDVEREALGVDFFILSGGEEIKFYIESTQPSSGALMERPVYTNVVNGIGIFSSMATQKVTGLNLASTTLDSIAYGQLTRHLGFVDHNGERNE